MEAVTYSIVARDPNTGELGVAVQSHWFAAGGTVPWAEAGVGAVATQAFLEMSYGPRALDLMREGATAKEALDRLIAGDTDQNVRQVGIVDVHGNVATHTGDRTIPAAGHTAGRAFTCQANMMWQDTVWDAMAAAYTGAEGVFAHRLLAALDAAEGERGDIRGRQAAGILIVGPQRLEEPWRGVRMHLHADHDPTPNAELRGSSTSTARTSTLSGPRSSSSSTTRSACSASARPPSPPGRTSSRSSTGRRSGSRPRAATTRRSR